MYVLLKNRGFKGLNRNFLSVTLQAGVHVDKEKLSSVSYLHEYVIVAKSVKFIPRTHLELKSELLCLGSTSLFS